MGTQVVDLFLRKGLVKEWVGLLGGGRIYPPKWGRSIAAKRLAGVVKEL